MGANLTISHLLPKAECQSLPRSPQQLHGGGELNTCYSIHSSAPLPPLLSELWFESDKFGPFVRPFPLSSFLAMHYIHGVISSTALTD